MPTKETLRDKIVDYYDQADTAYRNWSQVSNGEPYSCHCGFHPNGEPIEQGMSVALMTNLLIDRLEIDRSTGLVLDAGCGAGSVSYQVAKRYPGIVVVGLNIAGSQLVVADFHKKAAGLERLHFLLSSFDQIALAGNTADRVIFCESLCHSKNQRMTLSDVHRVTKTGGKIVIADVFLSERKPGITGQNYINDYQEGWFVSELRSIPDFILLLRDLGFYDVHAEDLSREILPSAQRFGINAEMRLNQPDNNATEAINKSRRACVAAQKLMETGVFVYNIITCRK